MSKLVRATDAAAEALFPKTGIDLNEVESPAAALLARISRQPIPQPSVEAGLQAWIDWLKEAEGYGAYAFARILRLSAVEEFSGYKHTMIYHFMAIGGFRNPFRCLILVARSAGTFWS